MTRRELAQAFAPVVVAAAVNIPTAAALGFPVPATIVDPNVERLAIAWNAARAEVAEAVRTHDATEEHFNSTRPKADDLLAGDREDVRAIIGSNFPVRASTARQITTDRKVRKALTDDGAYQTWLEALPADTVEWFADRVELAEAFEAARDAHAAEKAAGLAAASRAINVAEFRLADIIREVSALPFTPEAVGLRQRVAMVEFCTDPQDPSTFAGEWTERFPDDPEGLRNDYPERAAVLLKAAIEADASRLLKGGVNVPPPAAIHDPMAEAVAGFIRLGTEWDAGTIAPGIDDQVAEVADAIGEAGPATTAAGALAAFNLLLRLVPDYPGEKLDDAPGSIVTGLVEGVRGYLARRAA